MKTTNLKGQLLILPLLLAGLMIGCAHNGTTTSSGGGDTTPTPAAITCTTPASDVILSYGHSADYATYKLDWLEKSGTTYTLKTNQISLSSSGLKSPTFLTTYFLVVDSNATSRLLVYKRSDLSLAGQINIGSYAQDFVLVNNIAYIASGSNLLKRVDVSNLPNLAALSDITVGAKPSVVRCYNGKIYVGNQDWANKVQATVSIVDPATNTVSVTINVGENPTDFGNDGTRLWSYNAKWTGGTTASLTYVNSSNVPTNVTTFPATYAPAYGGNIAFKTTGGFVLLNNGTTLPDFSNLLHLFSITGTTVNTVAVDSTNQYRYLGAGSTYLYKIHNGNGSTSNLTTIIEDMSGSVLTTQTLTKDSDMYFFANN